MFLSVLAVASFPGFPGKSTGGPILGFSQGANCPHGLAGRSPSSVVFPFTNRMGGFATPGLLLPFKRRRPRQPSPHHRIAHALSPAAYRRDLPTVGRWRASPVMVQDHFLQVATRITVMVRDRHSARSIPRRGFGASSALLPRAVVDAPFRPKCRPPKSLCLAPSSTSLLRHPRWLMAGCLPLQKAAKFEQSVLYERGPAQVGFGLFSSSFHSLTLSSSGILGPEPLRLTHPFRVHQFVQHPLPG